MQDSLKQRESDSEAATCLPVLSGIASRDFLWSDGKTISSREFANRTAAFARSLPIRNLESAPTTLVSASSPASTPPTMINLCEDRSHFLLAYAAALSVGHSTLLPASRALAVITELEATHAGSYQIDDAAVAAASVDMRATGSQASGPQASGPQGTGTLDGKSICMIGFTSGSTGRSKSYPKTWASVSTSTALNERFIREAFNLSREGATPWIVATVPPQHMYGMEFSVLLPMLGGMAVHSGRPLFPADIAKALAEVPAPRILVTTPVHLRVLVESGISLPPLAGVISATAPLDKELAVRVERNLGTRMLEMFGSTETCIFATRQTARDESWHPYPGVDVSPRPDGARVMSPWLPEPMTLQDIVELLPDGSFIIRGRNSDFIDVAGKRASLAELTRRLLAIPGVHDAVVFPPEQSTPGRTNRVAALVVAPGLQALDVVSQLSASVDPAFLPRPLVIVDSLPRNETGKLPRESLLACLATSDR